jgi:hypothetical protein
VRAFGQPFDCQGWAQEVAAQVLELVAGGRGDGDIGMEGEALQARSSPAKDVPLPFVADDLARLGSHPLRAQAQRRRRLDRQRPAPLPPDRPVLMRSGAPEWRR